MLLLCFDGIKLLHSLQFRWPFCISEFLILQLLISGFGRLWSQIIHVVAKCTKFVLYMEVSVLVL